MSATDTSLVGGARRELDAIRLDLLRRRVLVLTCTVGGLLVLLSLAPLLMSRGELRPVRLAVASPMFAGLALIIMPFFRLRRQRATMTLRNLIRRTMMIVIVSAVVQMLQAGVTARSIEHLMLAAGAGYAQIGTLIPAAVSLLLVHLAASCIIPWTLRECAIPVAVVVLIAVITIPSLDDPMPARWAGVGALVLGGVPGMLVCWFRFSQLRQRVELRFLNRRMHELQSELALARRIHDKLFAQPIADGPIRFDFRYEPMRQIGGDFVDVSHDPANNTMTVVLIDVTGHGIAAALAVNRLHGEIKRVLAGQSGATPAQLLASLNSYIVATFSEQSVYATALALRVDAAARKIRWSSAGHPPAMLRRGDGRVEDLDSTAMLLGALAPEAFEPEERTLPFAPGDMLIAYTDGAIECRSGRSEQFGITRLRRSVSTIKGVHIPQALDQLRAQIEHWRDGEPEDDTLLIALAVG